MGAGIAQRIHLCLQSRGPGFKAHHHALSIYSHILYNILSSCCEKDENKQKEARIGPFKKVFSSSNFQNKALSTITVTLGEYKLHSSVEPLPPQTYHVVRAVVHPNFKFSPAADRFDVAVLRLDRPVQVSDGGQQQCDQIWRFIGLWPTFKCFWQHLICPNLSHA